MAVKVAINGLGRIGRCVARICADRDDIELVAANASGSEEMIQYNLKYDSVHGKRDDVRVENGYIYIGNEKVKLLSEENEKSSLQKKEFREEIVLLDEDARPEELNRETPSIVIFLAHNDSGRQWVLTGLLEYNQSNKKAD